jgi:hypothetical protein
LSGVRGTNPTFSSFSQDAQNKQLGPRSAK